MMNGARFKLLVPKENCVIIFCLAGIRCPQTSRNGSEAEPFADEAYAFSRAQCLQREVDVEIEAVDKNGSGQIDYNEFLAGQQELKKWKQKRKPQKKK